MPRQFLRRLIPHREKLTGHRSLRFLGSRIHDENLWHLNRYSASMAVFVGIFVGFLPIPVQMLIAAALALLLRCNLALSVSLVWLTNPITAPAVFYGTYKLGAFLLGIPATTVDFDLTFDAATRVLQESWEPVLLGSVVCGIFFGSIGYGATRIVWRMHVIRRWRQRKLRRQQRTARAQDGH